MAEGTYCVRPDILRVFVAEVFRAGGLNGENADFCANAMVDTNLWGVDSHGVLRLRIYATRLRSGALNPRPEIKTIKGSLGFEVLNGDDGPGFVVGRAAMLRVVELAEAYNVGAVGAVRSNHFGAAAIYARIAAERGMVGIAMTNVMPNMLAPDGKKPITGNNPVAVAIPTYGDFPFVLDMSLSAVAGGKLLLAAKKGEKIPLDWATDREGRPTDDPDKGFKGFLLPVGRFKGLGLSYVVDILCGVVLGGAFGDQLKSMYAHADEPSLTGHMMIAINLESIIGEDELRERMAAFCTRVKSSATWDEKAEMLIPGEIEYRTARARTESGIPIPVALYAELIQLGSEMGVKSSL